jgi:hypothetical protein
MEKARLIQTAHQRRGSATHNNMELDNMRERMARDRVEALVVQHTMSGKGMKKKNMAAAKKEDKMQMNDFGTYDDEDAAIGETRAEREAGELAKNLWDGMSQASVQDPSIGSLVQVSNTAVLSMEVNEKDIAEVEHMLHNAKSRNVQACLSTLLVCIFLFRCLMSNLYYSPTRYCSRTFQSPCPMSNVRSKPCLYNLQNDFKTQFMFPVGSWQDQEGPASISASDKMRKASEPHVAAQLEILAQAEAARKAGNQQAVGELLFYLVFMLFYSAINLRYLMSPKYFHLAETVGGQFTGTEMAWDHSPSFAKTYGDITTAEEYYHWLFGAFTTTIFSANTFDGDPSFAFLGGKQTGHTLGYNKFLGSVRLGQLRTQKRECSANEVPSALTEYYPFDCYGSPMDNVYVGGQPFPLAYETTEPFPATKPFVSVTNETGTKTSQFLFDGMYADSLRPMPEGSVTEHRAKYMTSYQTKQWNTYPSPAYNIYFNPTQPKEEVTNFLEELKAARYIDLGTKAIFVDATVYNPQLDIICWCRMTAEFVSLDAMQR